MKTNLIKIEVSILPCFYFRLRISISLFIAGCDTDDPNKGRCS